MPDIEVVVTQNVTEIAVDQSGLAVTVTPQPITVMVGALVDHEAEYDHAALKDHLTDTDNPHDTTAEQVSADPAGTATSVMSTHQSIYNHSQYNTAYAHSQETGNAHGLTLDDLGAAAAEHSHAISDITGLQDALNNKENAGAVTRNSLGLGTNDAVRFGELIIPGLVEGTTYRLIIDADGNLGTEQIT